MRVPFPVPAPGRPFDVVGFGLNSIDLVAVVAEHPAPNTKQRLQRFARMPGGQTATAMVACARLGLRARLRWVGRRFGAFSTFGITWAALLAVPGLVLLLLPMGVAGATRLVVAVELEPDYELEEFDETEPALKER